MSTEENPQERFDNFYITSSEIQEELKVERASVLYARRRGMLPAPIIVRGMRAFIWERAVLRPYLDSWKLSLQSRRKELTPSKSEAAKQRRPEKRGQFE